MFTLFSMCTRLDRQPTATQDTMSQSAVMMPRACRRSRRAAAALSDLLGCASIVITGSDFWNRHTDSADKGSLASCDRHSWDHLSGVPLGRSIVAARLKRGCPASPSFFSSILAGGGGRFAVTGTSGVTDCTSLDIERGSTSFRMWPSCRKGVTGFGRWPAMLAG